MTVGGVTDHPRHQIDAESALGKTWMTGDVVAHVLAHHLESLIGVRVLVRVQLPRVGVEMTGGECRHLPVLVTAAGRALAQSLHIPQIAGATDVAVMTMISSPKILNVSTAAAVTVEKEKRERKKKGTKRLFSSFVQELGSHSIVIEEEKRRCYIAVGAIRFDK